MHWRFRFFRIFNAIGVSQWIMETLSRVYMREFLGNIIFFDIESKNTESNITRKFEGNKLAT